MRSWRSTEVVAIVRWAHTCWSGVPFYLRTGKCLPVSASEVRIQFRPTPNVLFAAVCGQHLDLDSIRGAQFPA